MALGSGALFNEYSAPGKRSFPLWLGAIVLACSFAKDEGKPVNESTALSDSAHGVHWFNSCHDVGYKQRRKCFPSNIPRAAQEQIYPMLLICLVHI